jgi:hypothetical protein
MSSVQKENAKPVNIANQHPNNVHINNKNKDLKNTKIIKALYPRAAKDVVASFTDVRLQKRPKQLKIKH